MTTRRVLVVEDERHLRLTLERVLGRLGHEVHVAETGAEARRVLAERTVDVVVLDINLPDETGWSLLRWLRSSLEVAPTVVVVTAGVLAPSRVDTLRPDAVLTKPFPVDALCRLVNGEGLKTPESGIVETSP